MSTSNSIYSNLCYRQTIVIDLATNSLEEVKSLFLETIDTEILSLKETIDTR